MAEYIKREALLKHFCERCNEDYESEPCEPSECFAIQVIREVSAADVAPVVHGRLINIDKNEWYCDFGKCSVCGEENPTDAKYCLGCGARMDGE